MYWRVMSAIGMSRMSRFWRRIERAFERLQEHLERLRWNVQVARHLRDRFAVHDGEGHLALLGQHLGRILCADLEVAVQGLTHR